MRAKQFNPLHNVLWQDKPSYLLKLTLKEAQYEQMLVYTTDLQEKTVPYNL